MTVLVADIVALVQEIVKQDPIDWGNTAFTEDQAIELIANNLVDQYQRDWQHMPELERLHVMLAIMTKVIVENFSLQIQLRQ